MEVFETNWNVHCLVCEDQAKCQDPLDPDLVDSEVKDIKDGLERLENCPDDEGKESLVVEGKALISRVRRTGSRTASTFFAIGRK